MLSDNAKTQSKDFRFGPSRDPTFGGPSLARSLAHARLHMDSSLQN